MRNALVAAVLVFGGCNLYFNDNRTPPLPAGGGGGGGHPGGGGAGGWADAPPLSAEAMFDTTVYPVLEAECAACHVGGVVGFASVMGTQNDPTVMYDAITFNLLLNGCFDSTQALLINKGAHEGPALTPDQAQAFSGWLDAEAENRATQVQIGCVFPIVQQQLAEEEFASCETVSGNDITTTGASALSNLTSSQGTCASCHAGGVQPSTLAFAGTPSQMLQAWAEQAGLENVFTTVQDATTGTWQVVFDNPRFAAKGTELANGTGTHPSFTIPPSLVTAMQKYVADIDALETAEACPAPAFH